MIETAAEEMIAFQMANDIRPSEKTKTGISYKEKLAQRRKKTGGSTAAPQESSPVSQLVNTHTVPITTKKYSAFFIILIIYVLN